MGILSRLFGSKEADNPPDPLTPEVRASFETAAREIGWQFIRWEGSRAHFEAHGKQRFAGLDSFLASVAAERRKPTSADFVEYVRHIDGLMASENARREEAKDLTRIRQRLRPRLLTPDTVASAPDFPSGAYVDGELSRVLAIDYPETSSFVNQGILAAWGVSFEEAWGFALNNLSSIAGAAEFEPLPDYPEILLCSTEDEIGSSRVFVLPQAFPDHDPSKGFLFSVPSNDILLAHIIKGAGSVAVAPAMLNVALQLLQSQPRPLNASVFWLLRGEATRLNLTATANRGRTEINFVAAGRTAEFMKAVGAVGPGAA